jgi:hypothetical protein
MSVTIVNVFLPSPQLQTKVFVRDTSQNRGMNLYTQHNIQLVLTMLLTDAVA